MKRLVLTLAVCLFSLGILEAQNIWKPIDVPGTFLGVSSDGSIFTYFDDYFAYGEIVRSQDEGETWQVVLSFETESDISFLYNIEHGFTISEDGRVFVVAEHQVEGYLDYYCLFYSDDNGDTWQQTTGIPFFLVSGLVEFDGIAAPTNDIIVAWSSGGDYIWSIDGGATWDYTYYAPPHDGINLPHSLCEVIVNASGDIYASYLLYSDRTAAIARTNISHMSTWQGREMLGCTEIWDMEFGSDGNAYIGYIRDTTWNCGDVNYIQGDSYYVFAGQSIAVSDNGVVYKLRYIDDTHAVLNYSQHDANNFFDVGETMVISQSSSSLIHDGNIYKGRDNYLYFHGNGQYWKSVPDADHILDYDYFPLVHEGNDRQKWNVVYMASMNYPNDYFTEIQSIRDDITLDGVDYKLVWTKSKYGIAKAGAVREEDRRVYYRRKISQNYQDEVLLYDFNLTVGDTVTVNWMHQQLIVLEESEVEVNGTMRRQLGLGRYAVGYPPTEVDEYWIEGVGSTYGFLNSGYEEMLGSFYYLLCYYENGNLVWDNAEFDDCVMNSDGAPATFAPQGAEWYFDVFNPWGTHPEYQRFFVDGDTIIQGHQCSIITQHFVDTGHEGGEFVYEEDNKVYWFNPTSNAFSILYDFDAEAGESWYYEVGDCTHLATVDSVGSVTWNGHNYRTQWVRFNDDLPTYYSGKIIEGIGYERGLFPSIEVCNGWEVFDASEIEYLRCYVNDGEMLYHEGGYDCDYTNVTPPSHPEWYYEILNENGTITYQYMYQAGDTIINDEQTHILVKINTLYDKGLREEVTHEYVFELNGKLYWWNKRLGLFTVLYDYEAEVGDSWNIFVGTEILTMHVDGVDYIEYEGVSYRVLHVSDPDDLFSGNIVCGIGHLTSFFPEKLLGDGDRMRVEGMRCYWNEGELVFKYGDEDCDAVISDLHGVEENGPSTGSMTFTVYPNPTNGIIAIQHSSFRIHHSEFRITNLMGQTLLTGQITDETQQIDVSSLPKGMYFITFAGQTQKFVVR